MNSPHVTLTALSPLDGRYARQTATLAGYFSELGLIRYRVRVEVEYLIALLALLDRPEASDPAVTGALRACYLDFVLADAEAIKEKEATIRHDVKAVEYWLKEKVAVIPAIAADVELVHLGLTSEDVNNLAYALMQRDAMRDVVMPALAGVLDPLCDLVARYRAEPMLARTHGQPATPTTMGKELGVFASRLAGQLQTLVALPLPGKLNGATGTLAALSVAFPDKDWIGFSRDFVAGLGLKPNLVTTQVEPHDGYAALYDVLRRIDNILIDLCQDMWRYISDGYFRQRAVEAEVGSSAMPHKINPIDFENAEGNLGLANALLAHLGDKLTKSRLQRDLSDSTVLRNIGVAFGHLVLACQNLAKGLAKIDLDLDKLKADLIAHPEVLAEAIQTVMRAARVAVPYEALKALTRGRDVTLAELRDEALRLLPERAALWQSLAPETYVGCAPQLADEAYRQAMPVVAALNPS